MRKFKYFRPYNIFLEIVKCFIASCGITFLLFFFYYGKIEITKIQLQNMVFNLFSVFATIDIFYQLLINIKKHCEEEQVISTSTPLSIDAAKKEKDIPEKIKENREMMLKIISTHEAGHAIVALKLGLSIISVKAGIDKGYTLTSIKTHSLMTPEDFEKSVIMDYGGAAAEKVILGEIRAGSVGCETSDFTIAEERIKQMLLISGKFKGYASCGTDFSEQVQEYSIELFNKAEQIVLENKDVIQRLAVKLLKQDALSEEEVKLIIEE